MSNVRDTHRAAMRCAEQAKLASRAGHDVEASNLIRQAFELEREAAQLLLQSFDVEPTRSVLYRSAATLALECGEFAEARRLAPIKGWLVTLRKRSSGRFMKSSKRKSFKDISPLEGLHSTPKNFRCRLLDLRLLPDSRSGRR